MATATNHCPSQQTKQAVLASQHSIDLQLACHRHFLQGMSGTAVNSIPGMFHTGGKAAASHDKQNYHDKQNFVLVTGDEVGSDIDGTASKTAGQLLASMSRSLACSAIYIQSHLNTRNYLLHSLRTFEAAVCSVSRDQLLPIF
jgi:hypothetical protein